MKKKCIINTVSVLTGPKSDDPAMVILFCDVE